MKQIIMITDGTNFEVWTTLTNLCRVHIFSYHSLKSKKFPFVYKGLTFTKILINEKNLVGLDIKR